MYQAPFSASISRTSGTRLASTDLASVSRSQSAKWCARSASGRPMSAAIMLNSGFSAGVKKRILRSSSRNNIATSELVRMFSRSLARVRCWSSVSWSWLLSAVSSSLSDCSSSFEVSSSSLVVWNSSFTDMASSLIARISSSAVSRSRMAVSSSLRVASSSCSTCATRDASAGSSTAGSADLSGVGWSTKLSRTISAPSLVAVRALTVTATTPPSRFTRPAMLTVPSSAWPACSNAARIAGRRPSRAAASRSRFATPVGIFR